MDAVQPPSEDGAVDDRSADTGRQELRARDDSVLAHGNEPNRAGVSSVSEANPVWLGHLAMVGAPAVPALRGFVTT